MRKLKSDLRPVCSEEEISQLVGGYDVVGDVAIIIIPEELAVREQLIGDTLLAANPRLRTVAKRAGLYSGEFRTIPLTVIAGRDSTETEVKEFGIRLRLDPATVYYSVRSGSERQRVASLVTAGEQVLVMFSGIAPFPLHIAKYSAAAWITGIEKNPVAHAYGRENVQLNRSLNNISLYCGDVREVLTTIQHKFHRIIMPAPTLAGNYLEDALQVLAGGGTLHYYDMQAPDCFDRAVVAVEAACTASGRALVSAEVVRCGHCSPKSYRICVDAVIA